VRGRRRSPAPAGKEVVAGRSRGGRLVDLGRAEEHKRAELQASRGAEAGGAPVASR
jgi:hypothetical protein